MKSHHLFLLSVLQIVGCASNPETSGRSIGLPPGISMRELVETYRVSGTDPATIGQSLRNASVKAGGGQKFAGYYEWSINWRFEVERHDSQCRISKADIAIRSTVTLPEWTPPPGVDAPLVEEWKRYISALATHEVGHREVMLAGAIRIQRAIQDIPEQECGYMGTLVQQAAQPILNTIRLEDAQYDETTRHGATQGAVWSAVNRPWWEAQ